MTSSASPLRRLSLHPCSASAFPFTLIVFFPLRTKTQFLEGVPPYFPLELFLLKLVRFSALSSFATALRAAQFKPSAPGRFS